jgi:hypothetical protein
MKDDARRLSDRTLATAILSLLPATVVAQAAPPPAPPGRAGAKADDNPLGWTARAALSYVGTGGNSEASTAGLKFGVSYNWTRTYFTITGGGLRANSTFVTRFAVGPTQDDFSVVEAKDERKTAENYFLDATLDHNLTKRFYWQAGAGFLRNTFAGIDSRLAARSGVGYVFTDPDSKGAQLKGALLATLTRQSEVVDDAGTDDAFLGLRGILDFATRFGPDGKSTFASRLALDENLQSTDDLRGTWWNSLGVAMTDRLGLQVSVSVFYDNLPALSLMERYESASGALPVAPALGNVLVPLGKWDREFAVSLVINLLPKKAVPPPPPPRPAR